MELGKYYIEQERDGTIYGKAEKQGLKAETEPKPYETEGGYYVSIDESEEYEERLNRLQDFATIEEATKAAEPLMKKKIPLLSIAVYTEWDEDISYLQRRVWLTDAYGEPIKERKSKE